MRLLVGRQLNEPVSSLNAALGRRCPRCGRGRLFASYLKVADRCAVCGLDLKAQDSGDGPAVFIMLIVGFVVVGLALWVEVAFAPSYWVHLVLWFPLTFALVLTLLPVFKAWLVAQHYRHDLLKGGGADGGTP